MTQPATEEPISVRIARLKGCKPAYRFEGPGVGVIGSYWWCPDGEHESPGAYFRQINYLTAAASFALLAEMVEGPFQDDGEPIDGADVAIGKHGKLGYWFAANDGLNNQKASQLAYVSRVPTLGEAIALAYEAWATAKEARQ